MSVYFGCKKNQVVIKRKLICWKDVVLHSPICCLQQCCGTCHWLRLGFDAFQVVDSFRIVGWKRRNSNNLYIYILLTPSRTHVLLSKQFRPFLLPVTGQQLRTIFFLEKYKMMSCLPLKTGTTNWQRSLISLLYVDEGGTPRLDPNDVVKVIKCG